MKSCNCWKGYGRVPGAKQCAPGSCRKDSEARRKAVDVVVAKRGKR
jgi:hypothetical protein